MNRGGNLVLLSAGLDSAVNLLVARERGGVGMAVTVDYGQRAARREVERSRALCDSRGIEHVVVEAPWLGELSRDSLTTPRAPLPRVERGRLGDISRSLEAMRAVWVPNRNGLLVNIGACAAEAVGMKWVVMGLNAEEGSVFPDNSLGFLKEANHALACSTLSRVRLRSFTVRWDKMAILREAMARELDFHDIWSCYNGGELMCGSCESCARLLAAAERLRLTERLEGLFERAS